MMDRKSLGRLRKIVGRENVLTDPADLLLCGYDSSAAEGRPDAVVLPSSTEELAAVVRLSAERGIPVVASGAGANPSGGIAIVLSRMNQVIEINREDHIAVVQPAVAKLDLQSMLAAEGLRLCPDPTADQRSTIGDSVSENAAGPELLKHGVPPNQVLGLTVVLPDGGVRQLGGRVPDMPGYDLVGLFADSEDDLGVATEIIFKLTPLPDGDAPAEHPA